MGVVLDVDGGGAGIQASADARAAIPALRAGHIFAAARGLGDGAAGDVDGDSALLAVVFGVTAAAADACAAVFAASDLGDGATLDIDLGLAGDVGAGADACAAEPLVGVIARVKADSARGRDSAALDVDGGLIKGVAAGADAGTGSPAGSVLIAAALGLNDGDDAAVVAVADGDGGAAHRGIVDVTDIVAGADARSGGAAGSGNFCCTLDEDGGVAIGVAAAADACAAAAAKGGITAAGGRNGHAVAESDAGVAGGVAA